jgi:hypothetical protein
MLTGADQARLSSGIPKASTVISTNFQFAEWNQQARDLVRYSLRKVAWRVDVHRKTDGALLISRVQNICTAANSIAP